jgi:Ca2+-binding RTX toxin-like protein
MSAISSPVSSSTQRPTASSKETSDFAQALGTETRSKGETYYQTGTESSDELNGYEDPDHIDARGGNDTVWGGAENDIIYGGLGYDTINGGGGDDQIVEIAEDGLGFAVNGGAGNDTLRIASSSDSELYFLKDGNVWNVYQDQRILGTVTGIETVEIDNEDGTQSYLVPSRQ